MPEGHPEEAKFSWNSPPPDDAPLDVLGLYWGQIDDSIKVKALASTRSRLLEACIQKPELTASLLKILPRTPQAQDTIKQIYDENAERLSEGWRDDVKKYLKLNTKYFRDELVTDALQAKDEDEYGSVLNENELKNLATLDWPKAEPILRGFAATAKPRTSTLSKGLLYRHYADCGPKAEAEKLRRDLRSIAEDRKSLGYAREEAIDALFADGWSGREERFLSLFRDPTLRYLRDGGIRRPLLYRVGDDPEHWIPIVTHLVGNPNRAIHDNAVECLIQFQLRNARRDALTPLLPWL